MSRVGEGAASWQRRLFQACRVPAQSWFQVCGKKEPGAKRPEVNWPDSSIATDCGQVTATRLGGFDAAAADADGDEVMKGILQVLYNGGKTNSYK